MSTADDEPSSALNGRLRPRKSNVPSPQALKPTRSADGKSAQDKPKGASPAASAPDDLTTKSELSSTPQFLCPYCDKTFASKQTVSKHVHRVHFSSSKQDTFLDCLFCNHAEADANIVRHMVDSHPNQYFACLDCHTRFPSTTDLANHKLNICEKQKVAYNSRLRSKVSGAKKKKKLKFDKKETYSEEKKDFHDDHGFNGIVISCELKPSQVHDEEDIEDNITTNLILPPCTSLVGSAGLEKNAVIVLDDIQWNKRIPPNFSFHNTDHTADQILSRLGVVHRSPRTGDSTRRNWLKSLEDIPQKFEKCFDTSFYSKVASNVQENLSKYLDGSFNFNPDPHNTIKTRKLKNSVAINTAEGFPILLACEQYSRSALDSYLPRCIAPKHKWKWDNPDGDRNPLNADQLKRDSHVNNCIITLVSSLDIWTQLSMRRKFEDKFSSLPIERKIEKKNIIGKELKEILESREIPSRSQMVLYSTKSAPNTSRLDFPSSLGLAPSAPVPALQPAVLSGEWVRPRCYVCCACGAQTRDPRALSSHNSTHHPNSQVQHYEIVGEPLLNADIMQHLYVPPKQMANRTRPPRGIKDCTKCGKPIGLEELHQHMLDCAGDTPTVRRRTCRYRPFGVRKRRTRLPDNTIRKKMRKDIRSSHGRQKKLMRSRPKIRSEVGDAETIRKMLADLPAKRHRVMINPMNMIPRPRRKMEQQRSKMLLKKRPTHNRSARKTFNAHSSDNGSQGAPTNGEDPNKNTAHNDEDEDNKPLRPRIKRVIHKISMHNDTLKRQTLFNERKSKRPKRKPIRLKQQREAEEPSDSASSPPPSGSAPSFKEVSVGDDSHRIDVRRGPYNTREQANRGGGGARGGGGNFGGGGGGGRGGGGHRDDQQPGGGRANENPDNQYAPAQNTPLKHSIASLTSNSETQDKAVQFHHLFLVQQECNDANQHVPTGRQTLFENEAVVTKLDKPPLSYSQRAQADYYALQKNSKLNKTRKGLNDCIAMLKNKLVDPVPEVATGHVSVQCGSDEPIGPLMPSQMTSDLVGVNSVSPRGSFEVPPIFIPPPNQFVGLGSEIEIHVKQHDTVNKQHSLYSTDNQQSLTFSGKQQSPISAGNQQSPIYEGNQQGHISASNQPSPIYFSTQHDHTSAGNQQSHTSAGNQQSHISAGSQQSSSAASKQQSPISAYTQPSPNSDKQNSPASSNQQSPTSYKQPSPDASKRQTVGKRTKRRSNSNVVSQEHLVAQKVYQTRGIRRSQRRSTAQIEYDRAAQKRSLQYGPDIGIGSQKSFEYLYHEARRKSIEELSEIAIALQKPTDYKLYERAYRKSAERNVPPRMSPQKSSEYQYGDNPHGKIVESSPEIRISPRKSTEYHPYYEIPQTKRIDRSPVFGVSPQKPVEYPYPKVTQNNVIPEVRMTPTQPGYHYNDLRKHLQISPEISISQQKPGDYLYCQIAPINPVGHYPEMQISPQRPVPYQYCELLQKKSARRSVEMQVSPQKYITTQYRGQSHPPIERVPEIEVNSHVFDENKFREMMLSHPIEFGPEIFNGQQNLIEGQYLSPSSQKPQKIKTSRSSSQKSRTNSETEVQRFSDLYPTNDNFLLKPVIPSEADKTWRKNNEILPRESSAREQILPEVPLNAQQNVYPEGNVNFAPQPSIHQDRDAHLPPEPFSGNAQIDIHTAHGSIRLESSQESVPLDLSKTTKTNDAEKLPTRDYLMYNYDNYETIDLVKNSSDEDVLIDVENDGVVDLSVKSVPPGYETDTLDLCMKSQADNVPTDLSMKRNENVSNKLDGVTESQPIVDFPGQKPTLPELEHQELTQSYNDISPTDLSNKIDKTIPELKNTNNEISTDTIGTAVRENCRVTYDFVEQVPARSNYRNRCILEEEFQRPSETTEYQDDRNESLTPISNATKTLLELDAGNPAVSYANMITTQLAVSPCDNLPSGLKPTLCTTSEASSVNDLPVNKKLEESDLVYKHGNASYSESIIETSTPIVTKISILETIPRDNPLQSTDTVHILDTVTEQKTTPVSLQTQKQNQTDQEKETKDIDPTLDNDPETAKKIALLPKELVDILGNMPVDHRNQLLNILPQYVSTPTISSTSLNSSIQTTTNTTAQISTAVPCQPTTVTKSTTISQTEINTQSIPQPADSPNQPLNTHLMKSPPNIKYDTLYSNALATPMSILVKPQSNQEDKSTSPQVSPLPGKETANNEQEKVVYTVYTSTKSGVNDYNHTPLIKMTYDYKLSNNEAKHVSSDISRPLSIPNPNLTNITDNEKYQIQKKSNDQTASLRAVRIKAPSERQKDSQILKRSSIEQLSKPNINDTEVSEPIIEKSLAIQQAEISSTQHHSKNDEGEALISEAYDADLELNNSNTKTQRLTPDAVIASMPENKNDQIDGSTENEVPKQSVVTSSISCLKYDSENLSNPVKLNETIIKVSKKVNDTFSVESKLDDIAPPRGLVSQDAMIDTNKKALIHDSNRPKINEIEFEDDSDDDISLAAIVKQKRNQQKSVSRINYNNEYSKKKKKGKKHKKERRYHQVADNFSHKIDTSLITVAYSSSATCETESTSRIDNTTDKDSMEEDLTDTGQNTSEKVKKQNLNNDIVKDKDTISVKDKDNISVTSRNAIEKEEASVGDATEGLKTLKHSVSVDPTFQEISPINSTEVITNKIRLNEIDDSNKTLESSHLNEGSTCDNNSSYIKSGEKIKSKKNKKHPSKSLNIILTSKNDNDIDLTSLPKTNLIKDGIKNEISKEKINKTGEENIILENNIDEQTKASDPVTESLKLNSETNLSTTSELDLDNTKTPLRRSRRGKSLFVHNDFTVQSKAEKETESIDQKTPFTKKQLIFSKLLHDEEINAKLSVDESAPKEITNKDNCDNNLSTDATTSVALLHANEHLSESSVENKSIKRKKSPHAKRKCKKKKILVPSDCIKKLESNSDNDEISEQASSEVSKDVKTTERSDDISPINEANIDTCDDKNTADNDNQLLIFIEKRKSNNDRNNDDCQSSRAKKIKFNKNLENPAEETEIRSNKTNEAENKESPKSSATRPTMCYNMPVGSRRTRSKSVVEKTTNTDLYDPYNIDLDEMDEKTEPFRATGFMPKSKINVKANKSKLTEPKISNKQESLIEIHTSPKSFNLGSIKTHSKKSKCETIVSGEYAKTISESQKDVVDESGYRESHTANDISNDSVKGNISDSDDSTRSDVPLKKYVEEKQKKMAKLNNTIENETEHSDHSDGESDKSKSEEIKKKQKNSIVCKNASTVSILNEADEQLRSEQFMESFGFFSQRKPRKSNLLASKKIAATFHVIANDNDDMYFGPNQRITRKNPQSSSTSRRVTRRAPKKKNCDKTLSCLCRICQKLFRRPDNLMRHQLTLLHVSRLSELDLKLKTNCIPEEPNYLCAFKQYLDRLKRIAVKMGKYKKNPRFKLKMPTVKEIIENVHKGVLDQRVTSRNLSRDEALFLDCCELLKESHRNNVPPVKSFLPNHLFCAPKAAGTSRKSVEAMFKEDKPGETTPQACVCSHKPGDAAPHSPDCPQNPVNIALHSSTNSQRSVEAPTHSPNCPHNPRNAKPDPSTCPLRSGEVATHSSASLQKTEEAAPHSSTCLHKPGDAAPQLSASPHKNEESAPHSSVSPHKADDGSQHSPDCPHKPNEASTHSSACALKPEEAKDDGDVDSITAKAILESEEVRKLEKDLISVFRTARPGTFGSLNINNQPTSQDREGSPTATATSALNQAADSHDHTRKESKDVDPSESPRSDTVKSKKQIEVKDKMYPDVEEFDMFEDKFDKIKRKSRSQAAAAKMAQPAVHTSVRQARKKSDTKKGKKRTKKKSPSTVLTKGALKGFDSLKVSIPTSDINISALTQGPESSPKRKKKANSKKKKNKAETDTAARSNADDAPHRTSPKKDVYEFRDNEDAELFEFRPSTVMERFKLINNKEMERFKGHKDDEKAKNTVNKEVDRFKGMYAKEMDRFKVSSSKRTETYTSKNYPGADFDIFNKYADAIASTSSKETERFKMTSKDQPSTSKAYLDYSLGDADDDSSQSASDGDDFVYMSDHSDEVCSDDETRSTMSCEIGKNDLKKNTAPLKRKDAIEKNVVMGKIFKHNAVRAEKRIVKVDEPAKPNIDQLFDSLLYNEKQSSDRRAESPDDDTAEEDEAPKYEPLSVNVYDSSATTKKNPYTSPKKSCTVSPHFEPTPSTSFARYQEDSPERSEVSTNRYKMPSQSRYVDPYEFGPSTSKKPDPSIDLAYPSTSKQYDLDFLPKETKYSSPKKNERSHPPELEGPSTSKDTSGGREKPRRETEESNDGDGNGDVEEDAGVARQRARRKCTVGKQNVLAESWSSESEPDGAPPRPGSAQSDSSGGGRRKRGKRKDSGRKKAARKVDETRVSSSGPVETRAPTPPGAFVAPAPVGPGAGVGSGAGGQTVVGPDGKLRSVAYYWSSEGDEEQEHLQQHGWIVGDSHKKLVTMLAHAKGRKRNNDDKCHSE